MAIKYIKLEDAKQQSGLRMVTVPGIPSPWGEAAKGILKVKNIPWHGVQFDHRNKEMSQWTGSRSAPVVLYENEAPRGGWADILFLAERLSPEPALLPKDTALRSQALGLCHEICGEMGLGWCRRLDSVHSGLQGQGGYVEPIAQYLAKKYHYRPEQAVEYRQRVIELLGMLADILHKQAAAGQAFYMGSSLSAVDLYSATFMAPFNPLPQEQCAMLPPIRSAFESLDADTANALDPILIKHRDFIYDEFLELPLSL